MSSPSLTTPPTRRDLSRRARDAFPPMGIYAIRDRLSGRSRVFSSRNVPGAINRIRFELRLGSHPDKALQSAWREGGPQRVSIEIIELLKERADPLFDYAQELRLLERLHGDELKAGKGSA